MQGSRSGLPAGASTRSEAEVFNRFGFGIRRLACWKALTHSLRNHYFPSCTAGKITFTSSHDTNSVLWSFDPASGEERVIGPPPEPPGDEQTSKNGCYELVSSGKLEACGKDVDLSISRDDKQIGHFTLRSDCEIDDHGTIGKCDTLIDSLKWSPDGKWLLVGGRAIDYSGDDPQFDYYLVDLSTMKLTKAATAFDSLWLPGRDQIVFTTPQDLAQLTGSYERHKSSAKIYGEFLNVWVQHLFLFDPATGQSSAITSGVTNNFDASLCSL